jgi:ABC-2 type transport system permease protein
MRKLTTILTFEYFTFVKSPAFIVMTIIMFLVGMVLPMVPSLQGIASTIVGEGSERVAVADTQGRFPPGKWAEYLPDYECVFYPSAEEALAAVINGFCAIAVEIGADDYTMYVSAMKLTYYNLENQIKNMVRTGYRLQKMTEAGLSAQAADDILNYDPSGSIVTVAMPDEDDGGNYQQNLVYAYVMLFILYFTLMSSGQYILTSVVREKTTKTMELLITSCKTDTLIHGKVLGVGLAGLTQMAVIAAASGLSMLAAGRGKPADEMLASGIPPDVIAFMVLFFMLGFFAYAYLYAGLGSTVSRMEDAGSVSMLPMMLIIAGFFGAIFGMFTPGAVWVRVLSHIPLISPMVMFMRVCVHTAPWWEACLAAAVQFTAIMFFGWLSARIYRMGTLLYGNKPNLRELARLLRQH